MPIELLPLPYDRSALLPYLSAETLDYHHGKHHRGYVDRLNELIAGTELDELPLEEVVRRAQGTVFNQAAQVWNHDFYWRCLRPRGGGEPVGPLSEKIALAFGDATRLRAEFNRVAMATFGSGWTWLVQRSDGTLAVLVTSNASTPLTGQDVPLLACDVWEHAYYIDYRDARAQYLDAFWNLVNWDFVASQLR
ncbi:MAG TPA: Fe-Mn family superoxide dismutase [Stenotrophomonas sp.]|jgi:Fe-Mn family superoxide dismutase